MSDRRSGGVEVIDAVSARERLEHAIEVHRPEVGRFFLAQFLGFNFEYGEDSCTIRFEVRDFMLNPSGALHGGLAATVLDTAMGHLISHLHARAATVEMKTQYLRAVLPGECTAVATVLKRGSRLWFVQADLYDSDQKLAAFSTATWAV